MTGLATFVTGFSFWAAVGILGSSGALTLSKVRFGQPGSASRCGGLLVVGVVFALLIAAAPRIMVTSPGVVVSGGAGGQGGGTARPGLMEYFATLSPDERLIAGVAVAVWATAVVATIAAALSRPGSTAE